MKGARVALIAAMVLLGHSRHVGRLWARPSGTPPRLRQADSAQSNPRPCASEMARSLQGGTRKVSLTTRTATILTKGREPRSPSPVANTSLRHLSRISATTIRKTTTRTFRLDCGNSFTKAATFPPGWRRSTREPGSCRQVWRNGLSVGKHCPLIIRPISTGYPMSPMREAVRCRLTVPSTSMEETSSCSTTTPRRSSTSCAACTDQDDLGRGGRLRAKPGRAGPRTRAAGTSAGRGR